MDFCVPDNGNVKENTTDNLPYLTFIDLGLFEKVFLASYEYNDPFVRNNLMKEFSLHHYTRKVILYDTEEAIKSR